MTRIRCTSTRPEYLRPRPHYTYYYVEFRYLRLIELSPYGVFFARGLYVASSLTAQPQLPGGPGSSFRFGFWCFTVPVRLSKLRSSQKICMCNQLFACPLRTAQRQTVRLFGDQLATRHRHTHGPATPTQIPPRTHPTSFRLTHSVVSTPFGSAFDSIAGSPWEKFVDPQGGHQVLGPVELVSPSPPGPSTPFFQSPTSNSAQRNPHFPPYYPQKITEISRPFTMVLAAPSTDVSLIHNPEFSARVVLNTPVKAPKRSTNLIGHSQLS